MIQFILVRTGGDALKKRPIFGGPILVGERFLFLFPTFFFHYFLNQISFLFLFFFSLFWINTKKLAADKHSARFLAHGLLCPQGNVQLPLALGLSSTHFDYCNLHFTQIQTKPPPFFFFFFFLDLEKWMPIMQYYGSCMSVVAKKKKKMMMKSISRWHTLIFRFVSSCMQWCKM